MAGFWHLSHHQMRDPNGRVLANAKAFFFRSDTLLPLTTYQDYGLGTPHPNPVQANAYGVFPPVFLNETDGFYRQRITTAAGVIVPGTDVGTLPIIGPSGGGGGAIAPVDPNAIYKTGDLLWMDVTGSRAGWVRDNARTIGSALSGAAERANADCEALFTFLWQNFTDTICPVGGGRGANAAADWAANKTIQTPDKRGRAAFGLDDMGNAAANRYTSVPFSLGDAVTAGSLGGEALHTLTTPETPAHVHTGTTDASSHSHNVSDQFGDGTVSQGTGVLQGFFQRGTSGSGSRTNATSITQTFTTNSTGGGGAHNNMPLLVTGTFYRKL